jgi:hypothetical protein
MEYFALALGNLRIDCCRCDASASSVGNGPLITGFWNDDARGGILADLEVGIVQAQVWSWNWARTSFYPCNIIVLYLSSRLVFVLFNLEFERGGKRIMFDTMAVVWLKHGLRPPGPP